MSILGELQHFLQAYDKVLSLIVGGSGWIYALLRSRRDAKAKLTLTCTNGELFLENHGSKSIEAHQAGISLRDPLARPDLAKKQTFFLGIGQTASSNGRIKIATIDETLVRSIEYVSGRQANTLAAYGIKNPAECAAMELHLSYSLVGDDEMRAIKFDRRVLGSRNLGWSVQFPPYYSRNHGPLRQRLFVRLDRIANAVKNPRAWWRNRKPYKWLGEHLAVMGILRAIKDNTITEEEGIRRLEQMARKARVDPVELVHRHVAEAERNHQENLDWLKGNQPNSD